ncbi:MAG: exodeoxyribonuclease VII large subunit [Pseudomonadota bacterium]
MADSPVSNLPELTVSELSAAVKRTVETAYDHVRVRGELGRVTIARSGHMYADLKDDKAVLNTIMWKGQVSRLPFRPEEGLEVIATGRMSTYPGRSNYQLIADTLRPAGVGALMALLEERKKKLAAEGLFDPDHKKPLPFLPRTVGVVTSPTGAVIRDILHRIRDRFPVRVILWPALVQGDTAAPQIVAGIRGFNAMPDKVRPDVLIVGRGGGSIEDLWPFNEEEVVRAAFESTIPLISAVGHETDTTLIDYVSDARAPTPTGAAEIAVPVRSELKLQIDDIEQRKRRALVRYIKRGQERLEATRLPPATRLFESKRQRFDTVADRLPLATRALVERRRAKLDALSAGLISPKQVITEKHARLLALSTRLGAGLAKGTAKKRVEFTQTASLLRPEPLIADARRARNSLIDTARRARPALDRILKTKQQAFQAQEKLLETLSYQATLKRGYAIVKAPDGKIVRSAQQISQLPQVDLTVANGEVSLTPIGDVKPAPKPKPKRTTANKTPSKPDGSDQGDLF